MIRPRVYTQVFTFGAMLFLSMVFVLSLTRSTPVAMVTLFVAGLGLAGFSAMQSTILLAGSASELRSRVMGVLVVCIGTAPLGVLSVGWMAERFGVALALSISSGCGLLCLGMLCVWRPRLVRAFGVSLTEAPANK